MKHFVVMMVGVVVDADDVNHAFKKASTPLSYGILPGVIGIINSGTRVATDTDTAEMFKERMDKIRGL